MLLCFVVSVQGAITYVDAEHGATGNTVDAVTGDPSSWQSTTNNSYDTIWRTRGGNDAAAENDVYEASGHEDAVLLKTTLTGLAAGASYDIYVYFGTSNLIPEGGGSSTSWKILAGLSDTVLTVFAPETDGELVTDTSDVDMYRAYVGMGVADGSGQLAVYIDNYESATQRCWYDGIGYEKVRGYAHSPSPADGATVDGDVVANQLSWVSGDVPEDPNLTVNSFDLVYYSKPTDSVTTDDPNFANPANGVVTLSNESSPYALTFDYDTTYFWRVDSHVTWDSNDITGNSSEVLEGFTWTFNTLQADEDPIVDIPVNNYVTWLDNLPETGLAGTVDDLEEGDVSLSGINWSIETYPDKPIDNSARVIDRITGASQDVLDDLAELEVAGYDPNLLGDWIGTDNRGSNPDTPLVLTLSGLPAGTYTWTSTHHDVAGMTGLFDVTVVDDAGSVTTTDVDISDSNDIPTTFTTTVASNGTDDVKLIFDLQEITILVINGFELTGTGDPLKIDFCNQTTDTAVGYQAYRVMDKDLASFTAQDFSAFGMTVTVHAEFGPIPAGWLTAAAVTDTSSDPLTPTASFTTDYPGEYTIQLTATDGSAQSDSDTVTVTVLADACQAAQTVSGFTFNEYDTDQDCDVDLVDFAAFAQQWLDDVNLTEGYTE